MATKDIDDPRVTEIADGYGLSKNTECWTVYSKRKKENGEACWFAKWYYPTVKSLADGLVERIPEIGSNSNNGLAAIVEIVEDLKKEIRNYLSDDSRA